ncbi:MAG: hypothetical protein ACKVH8_12715 [Pirellulales bacterium]|jgi:hypothetical protein
MNQTAKKIVRYFSVITPCLCGATIMLGATHEAAAQLKQSGSARVHQSTSRWTHPLGGGINISTDRVYSVAQVPATRTVYRSMNQSGYANRTSIAAPSSRRNHYYGGWGGISYGNPWYNNPMFINYQPTQVVEVPVESQPVPRRTETRKRPLVLEFNQKTGKAERRYSSGSKVIENIEK